MHGRNKNKNVWKKIRIKGGKRRLGRRKMEEMGRGSIEERTDEREELWKRGRMEKRK